MRNLMLTSALAALLLACSPPAQREQAPTPQAETPGVQACNSVAPNASLQVAVQEGLASAAAAADLRGGRITPGTYDLSSAQRIGSATGWQGTRAVALEITEEPNGPLVLSWAGAGPDGALDTWTANLTDVAQQAQLTYTCGRIGEVLADFAATGTTLQLQIPDGGSGSLQLDFQRRP